MKKKTRILSLILAVVLTVGILPAGVSAAYFPQAGAIDGAGGVANAVEAFLRGDLHHPDAGEVTGKVGDVRWDSAAFNAGIGSGMQVLAVNDLQYSAGELEEAVRMAKHDKAPIRLLVKQMDVYRTLSIDYTDGLRYPALQRIEGTADYLTPILSAKK